MTPKPHERLAAAIEARRGDLGLSLREVGELAGITSETLRAVRKGSNEPSSLTKRGIERALQWASGSVDAVLRGDGPLPAAEPPADPMGTAEATLDDSERMLADMKTLNRRDRRAVDALIQALKNPDRNGTVADNNHR